MYIDQPINSRRFNDLPCDTISYPFSINNKTEHRNIKVLRPYEFSTAYRVVAVALVVITLTVCVLALQDKLVGFPQHFLHWVHNINVTHAVVGMNIAVALTGGAFIVICHVKNKIGDPTTGKTMGRSDQWMPGVILYQEEGKLCCKNLFYVDTSSIDKKKLGKALNYSPCLSPFHEIISNAISWYTPLHMVGAMVYNVIRAVVIPFYILGCIVTEKWKGRALYPKELYPKEREFQWSDIYKQMHLSFWRIVRAPFYATAYIFATLYSFVNPPAGTKLSSWIERDWNNGVPLREGFWLCNRQEDFKWEGGGGPKGLGKHAAYGAGCRQRIGSTEFGEDGIKLYGNSGDLLTADVKIIEGGLVAIIKTSDFHFIDDESVS